MLENQWKSSKGKNGAREQILNHLWMDVALWCYTWMGLGMDGVLVCVRKHNDMAPHESFQKNHIFFIFQTAHTTYSFIAEYS